MSVSKIVAAAASSAGGAGLDVNEVFSTTVYDGNGGTQSIVNSIDLSGEGGFVWIKNRGPSGFGSALYDTVRGATYGLESTSNTNAQAQETSGLTAFNSNGFTLGNRSTLNASNETYVAWTWRKAPKFFDVVTWSDGDGTTNHSKQISHNLGSTPGMIIVKKTSNTDRWQVAHRGMSTGDVLYLNTDDAKNELDADTVRIVNDSYFTIAYNQTNEESNSYVAYLFAHNNGDGGFGPSGDQDIIKCGSYTGAGSPYTGGSEINLGFEPQFVLIKRASHSKNWVIIDNMRGWGAGTEGRQNWLYPNTNGTDNSDGQIAYITPTGFKPYGGSLSNDTGTYIYMAIRRGPLAEPDGATKVFNVGTVQNNTHRTLTNSLTGKLNPDFVLYRTTADGANWFAQTRLMGKDTLFPNTNAAANTSAYGNSWNKVMHNVSADGTASTGTSSFGFMWARAPSYFDVVAYSGTGSARTVPHNLGLHGAVPEMMWIKKRSGSNNWKTFHSSLGATKSMELNTTVAAETNGSALWNSTAPTASVFTVGSAGDVNSSSHVYIAYLFATVAGISKCGSYTGNGSTTGPIVDCGFSNGARFVLIKRTDTTGDWVVYDTERGITAGDDKTLELNTTDAETTGQVLNPHSSGFQLATADSFANASGGTYIFYAIA